MDDISRQALATALAVVAAVYIAIAMGFEQPYWAALSVVIISNVDRSAMFTKGVLRIAGTIVGVTGGYVVAQWLEGQPVAQALLLMLLAGLGTYGRQRSDYGYAWFYGALSALLVLLCSMTTPGQLYSFAHFRCYEIVIGVTVATIANWALGPRAGELPTGLTAAPTGISAENAAWQGLAAAIGSLAIVFAWVAFDLPALTQVLISSLVVVDADPAATRHRGFQRILGCVIGGATGLAIIGIDATNVVWWTASLFLGVFLFARVHLGKTANTYVGTQSAVALLVTMVDSGPPASVVAPLDRLVGIMLGVALMTAVVWVMNVKPPPEKAAALKPE